MDDVLTRLRDICLARPETTERASHGTPCFFVRDRHAFVYAWLGGHHERAEPHLWCAAPAGLQESLCAAEPTRYFRPPYVGSRGWIGVRLGTALDWGEVAQRCEDAFITVAPARLAARWSVECRDPGEP